MATQLVLDLSNNNLYPDFWSIANWRGPSGERVVGVMLKVSEGVNFTDQVFGDWSYRARRAGLRVGGYHFAQPNGGDAKAEARAFARRLGAVKKRDFRPALDLERNAGGLSWRELVAWSRAFNQEFFRLTKHLPMIYASKSWLDSMRAETPIGAALWLAHWSNDAMPFRPVAPYPWKRVHLHQFTSEAHRRSPLHPEGISGRVDINHILALRPLLAYPTTLDRVRAVAAWRPQEGC